MFVRTQKGTSFDIQKSLKISTTPEFNEEFKNAISLDTGCLLDFLGKNNVFNKFFAKRVKNVGSYDRRFLRKILEKIAGIDSLSEIKALCLSRFNQYVVLLSEVVRRLYIYSDSYTYKDVRHLVQSSILFHRTLKRSFYMPSEIYFIIDPSFPPRGRVRLEFFVDTLVVSIVKNDDDSSQPIGTSLFPDLPMDSKTCVWAYVNENNLVPTHSVFGYGTPELTHMTRQLGRSGGHRGHFSNVIKSDFMRRFSAQEIVLKILHYFYSVVNSSPDMLMKLLEDISSMVPDVCMLTEIFEIEFPAVQSSCENRPELHEIEGAFFEVIDVKDAFFVAEVDTVYLEHPHDMGKLCGNSRVNICNNDCMDTTTSMLDDRMRVGTAENAIFGSMSPFQNVLFLYELCGKLHDTCGKLVTKFEPCLFGFESLLAIHRAKNAVFCNTPYFTGCRSLCMDIFRVDASIVDE